MPDDGLDQRPAGWNGILVGFSGDETVLKHSRNQIALNSGKSPFDQKGVRGDGHDPDRFQGRNRVPARAVRHAHPAREATVHEALEAAQVTLLIGPLLYVLLAIAAVKAKRAGMSNVEVALIVSVGVLFIPVAMTGILAWGVPGFG